MILYVNGDSHSAGAEAVNAHAFANDDSKFQMLGRKPHPDNLQASYGNLLANKLNSDFYCDAESASSNDRIIRTTKEYLQNNPAPDLIIIGWATWEREEWLHDGVYWQVNAGGIADDWPKEIKDRYRAWVIEQSDFEVINQKYIDVHRKIHDFHLFLEQAKIPHYFFNTFSDFGHLKVLGLEELDWNGCYLEPYNHDYAYYYWLLANGYKTTRSDGYHYGADAHAAWADYLYDQIPESCLTKK
jgi:hypothetical protein